MPPRRLRLAIVADDLTGALDSAATLAGPGRRVVVELPGGSVDGSLPVHGDPDVLAFATGSRDLPWADGEPRVRVALTRAIGAHPDDLLLKVDSQLRGYPAAEVELALDLLGPDWIAVVAPAYPSHGRTTSGGVQHVGSRSIDIVGLFAGSSRDVRTLGTDPTELGALQRSGARIVVADAASDRELRAVVAAGRTLDSVLWVGSAGLAGALEADYGGRHAAVERSSVGAASTSRGDSNARILVVAGSASPETAAQTARLIELLHPRVIANSADALADLLERVRAALAISPVVVVSAPPVGANAASLHPSHAATLARVAAAVADELDGLVVSGGETLLAITASLGLRALVVHDEVEPGVPLSAPVDASTPTIVSKAGSFGDADALARAVEHLRLRLADR